MCSEGIAKEGVPGYDKTFRILIVDVARIIYVLSFMDLHAKLSILSILLYLSLKEQQNNELQKVSLNT